MSDPAELNRILRDLADGKVEPDEAARLIADLDRPAERERMAPEDLYDDPGSDGPPARALPDDPQPAPSEPDEPVANEQPADEADAEQAQPDEEPDADQEAAKPDDSQPGRGLLDIEIDNVAAVAGEVFRDAGEMARGAWQRLGDFANSVLPGDAGSVIPDPPHFPQPGVSRPAGTKSSVETLIVRSVGRRVRIVGDYRIGTASVDGPHTIRRQGTTLEVTTEGELGVNTNGLSLIRPPRSVEDLRVLGFGKELVVRVNPSITVDAEVTGNKLTTLGVPKLGNIRVSVGQASLSDVVEVHDALIQAGGASLSGPLSEGRSRIKVESGNLSVRLTHGANVTVRSATQLGRISWPEESQANLDEYVVGNGSAQLEVGVVMGRAVIKVDEQA